MYVGSFFLNKVLLNLTETTKQICLLLKTKCNPSRNVYTDDFFYCIKKDYFLVRKYKKSS